MSNAKIQESEYNNILNLYNDGATAPEIAKMYESLKQNKACAVDTDNNTRRITLERKLDLIYISSNRNQFFQYLLTVNKFMN